MREIFGTIIASLQKITAILSKPAGLIPSAQDLQKYLVSNLDEETRGKLEGTLEHLVNEGEVTGDVWIAMVHALRRSTDRDVLTRDARHAGLRKLDYTEKGVGKYILYLRVLLVVSDYEHDALGCKVFDKKGKPKKGSVILPPEYVHAKKDVSALFAKGAKAPVWRPLTKDPPAWAAALPETDFVPDVQVPLMVDDALMFGAQHTCIFYLLWEDLVRIAPTLKLNKAWEEGLPDKIKNHTFSMTDDVERVVPDTGPGLGYVSPVQISGKIVGMQMTSIMRSGDLMPTLPPKRQLMNPRHFSFIFRQAREYQFTDATFPNGRNRCYLHCIDKVQGAWLLISPLPHPFKKGSNSYRSMIIDTRLGLLRCCVEFIWVMGWGDPGAQRDFDAIIQFKRNVLDGMRDLASQIEDWRIDWAARRPGVKAEEEKKDTDAAYDQTGKTKNWCHRKTWLRRYRARLDHISERRVQEFRLMAANDTLTITLLHTEWNNGFLGRHLTEEARRALFLPLYRLAYEVVERVDVAPAFGSETFYRNAASKLIAEGLYLHLPEDEKAAKKGQLMVKADYCQMVLMTKGSVLNNARATDGHKDLLDKGFGFYPPGFMNLELVDRIHEIITAFYEQDKVFVDKFMKLWARRSAFGYTVPINDEHALEQDKLLLNVIGMGCGAEERLEEIELILGTPLTLSPAGLGKMRAVEFAWRMGRLWELLKIEEVWRKCGVDVEKEGVSLTKMWLRLVKANDRGVLDKMKTTTDAKKLERLETSLFYTACKGDFDEHRSEFVEQLGKEL